MLAKGGEGMVTLKKRAARKKNGLLWGVLLVAGIAWIATECMVAEALNVYAQHAAATAAQETFAAAVKQLCETDAFADMVTVKTDEDGRAQTLMTDAAAQNAVQAKLASALCDGFEQRDRAAFSVPLGTLLGDPLWSGKGPSVKFFTALSCSPVVTLSDEFTDAGINQTYHTVTANVTVTVLVTAMGKSRETTLSLSAPLSQTAVVGDVPRFYASF